MYDQDKPWHWCRCCGNTIVNNDNTFPAHVPNMAVKMMLAKIKGLEERLNKCLSL